MQDHALVKSLQTRRTSTLAAVYDLYAQPLYGYCWLLLYDRTEAEAALRDAFLAAELRIDELGDPGKLKPWLFAIARGEATRRRTAGEPVSRQNHPVADSPATPTRPTASRSMAETAVAALDSAEREALELAERHGLAETDVAVVLDLSVRRAHALLARADQHLREALTAVILARTGREQCRRLAGLTEGDARLDAARCRRLRRHASMCRKCGKRGSHRASAAKVLTLLAPVEIPAGLRWQVLNSYTDPALIGYRLHVARRVGALGPTGFPLPGGRRRRAGRQRAAAAAVTCLLVLVAAVLANPRFRPSESPGDLSLLTPGGQAQPTGSYLPSTPAIGQSANRPPPRPSPSPAPLGARTVGAKGPVLLGSPPTAPIAAAADLVGVRDGRSRFFPPPPFDDGHAGDPGGSPDGSRSRQGWATGAPSGSGHGEPSRSRSEPPTQEQGSSPAPTADESRTETPTRSPDH